MNPDIKKRWVAALRSGEYQQGQFGLRNSLNGYCCLGVLVDLAVKEGVVNWSNEPVHGNDPLSSYYQVLHGFQSIGASILPVNVTTWAGLDFGECNPIVTVEIDGTEESCGLAGLNDSAQWSFGHIADVIEEQL